MAFLKAIKPFFPFSYREKTGKDLAWSIVIYAIIQLLVAIILGVTVGITAVVAGAIDMAWIAWSVGAVAGLIETVVGIYVVGGIVMSILHFTGVLDKINQPAENDKKDAE